MGHIAELKASLSEEESVVVLGFLESVGLGRAQSSPAHPSSCFLCWLCSAAWDCWEFVLPGLEPALEQGLLPELCHAPNHPSIPQPGLESIKITVISRV